MLEDPQNNMYQLVMNILKETDSEVLKATFENFFPSTRISSVGQSRRNTGRNITAIFPWAILLLDPTSACNLHCTGCWAANTANKLNLTFEEIDGIITQGKEMGVYMYIYTGGELLSQKGPDRPV